MMRCCLLNSHLVWILSNELLKKKYFPFLKAYARSTGFSIYTYETRDLHPFIDSKHFIYRHDPMSGCPSPIMNVTVNYVTQGIVFINERPMGYRSNCPGDDIQYTGIDLCEVRVMGTFLFEMLILHI